VPRHNNNQFRGQILSALKHNKDGSFATQDERKRILLNVSKDLVKCGFGRVTQQNYGGRHAKALAKYWQDQGIAIATVKNRISHMRWLAEKFGRPEAIPKDNTTLDIGQRTYSDNIKNLAKELEIDKMEKLSERQVLCLKLQRSFGLRREESLKFKPNQADKGNKVELQASWCKGGRAREIPVRTQEQRELLEQCKKIAGIGSMIEKDKTYIQARNLLDKTCQRSEIYHNHGYRHAYAQERYKELTGLNCPKAGGKISTELTEEEKQKDFDARMTVSNELGHGREEITVNYLGR
jgi:hypothetical protein